MRDELPRKPRSSVSLGELAARVSVPMTHQTVLSVYATRFTTNTMRRAYRLFDGDLTGFLVFAEIAQHNMSRALSALDFRGAPDSARWRTLMRALPRQEVAPCNALSISAATGIPRETVRRKVKQLQERGWLVRAGARRLTLAPRAIEQLGSSEHDILEDFRETSRVIRLLEDVLTAQARPRRPGACR
jgi:biotin operon repressor